MNLTGRKSVTGSDLQNLEELGITVTASEEATEALERSGSSWGAERLQFPYLWGDEQLVKRHDNYLIIMSHSIPFYSLCFTPICDTLKTRLKLNF